MPRFTVPAVHNNRGNIAVQHKALACFSRHPSTALLSSTELFQQSGNIDQVLFAAEDVRDFPRLAPEAELVPAKACDTGSIDNALKGGYTVAFCFLSHGAYPPKVAR